MERWKDIAGLEGRYKVSDQGNVFSVISDRLINPSTTAKGYQRVYLYVDGTKKNRRCVFVHRLVAEAFLEKPNGVTEVNHIDGDKTNNCADNLEWCDHYHNMSHSYYKLRQQAGVERRKVKVRCVETGKVYESGSAADRDLGLVIGSTLKVARGHSGKANVLSAKGYHFEII